MNASTNPTTASVPQMTPSIPISTVYQLTEPGLKALYQTVKEYLRLNRLVSTDNINVVSVRLTLETCNKVRRLAVAKKTPSRRSFPRH